MGAAPLTHDLHRELPDGGRYDAQKAAHKSFPARDRHVHEVVGLEHKVFAAGSANGLKITVDLFFAAAAGHWPEGARGVGWGTGHRPDRHSNRLRNRERLF